MTDLVIVEHNEAFTTSLAIAEGTNNEHRAVLQLIKRHKARFERFGNLKMISAFEMQKSLNRSNRGRTTVLYALNEAQATLLMTMMKNTPKVLDFKEALVDAFFKARNLLMTGQMGLMQTHAILTLALDNERQNASECGKGLAEWKRKRDELEYAIDRVKRQIQPELPFFDCQ